MITLNNLPIGSTATIESLLFTGTIRRRMLDLGIAPNTKITIISIVHFNINFFGKICSHIKF